MGGGWSRISFGCEPISLELYTDARKETVDPTYTELLYTTLQKDNSYG